MDRGDGPRDGGEELKVSRIEKFLAKRQMMQTEKRKSWEKWRGFENVATGPGTAKSNGKANCKGCEHNHIPGKISLYAKGTLKFMCRAAQDLGQWASLQAEKSYQVCDYLPFEA